MVDLTKYGAKLVNPLAKYGAIPVGQPSPKPDTTFQDWTGINPATYWKDSWNQLVETVKHPVQAIGNVFQAGVSNITGTFQHAGMDIGEAIDVEGDNWSRNTADIMNALGASASVLFLPMTTIFAAAEKLPALKQGADIVNAIFTTAGKIGEFPAEKFVDVLPISNADKDILRPAFGEMGALAGQVILGGKVMHSISKGIKLGKKEVKKLTEETVKEVEIAKKETVKKVEVSKPKQRLAELRGILNTEYATKKEIREKLKDSFTPQDINAILKDVPTKVAGEELVVKVEDVVRTIELQDIYKKREGGKITPLPTSYGAKVVEPIITEKAAKQPIKTTEVSPKTKIDENRVNEFERSLGETEFEGTTRARQARLAEEYASTDMKKLEDIASRKIANDELRPTSAEKYLGKYGTPEQAVRVTENPYASSRAGSELSLTQAFDEINMVDRIREVQRTVDKRTEKTTKIKETIMKEAKTARDTIPKETLMTKLNKFIEDIETC